MSELEYQPTLTTPKSSSSTEPDELSSDLHHIRTTLVSMFAFLTDRPPTHINLVLDDCHRGKESFTGKFEHRLRTTVFLLSPDGKGVEAVLARFVYEKRDDNLKRTLCELQWGALDKVYQATHQAVVEKMDTMDRRTGGLVQTRFRMVDGKLVDSASGVFGGAPPYKSEYSGY